ncbi:MAG TPA: DUF3558 family protein, partial [Acidimicrobiales bacterium]
MIPTPIRRAATAAAVLALVAGLGACSTSGKASTDAPTTVAATTPSTAATTAATTDTTEPAAAPDPCNLVTKAQAEKVVGGVTLNDPTKAGSGDDVLCQFTSDPNGPTAQVEVFVGSGVKKQLDIDKDTLKHPFTTLTGIGDEAYLEADNVFVRKGAGWASVNIVDLDTPAD